MDITNLAKMASIIPWGLLLYPFGFAAQATGLVMQIVGFAVLVFLWYLK